MGRIKLVEKMIVDAKEIKQISLKEGKQIIKEGRTYECISAYTFPISRPDEKNLNERIYSSTLWERVLGLKMGESSYGLMDHPDSEGSTKDRFCVWHNIRFSEDRKLIVADAYLFGKWGQDVEDGIKAGGEVGLSTVGLGEFLEDDITIDPETYELERASDFVLTPSYEVYGSIENRIENKVSEKKETIITNDINPLEKKVDKELNKMKDTKVKGIEEKNFRLQVKSLIKEASATPDLHRKKAEYEDILTYFEDDSATDLRKELVKRINECGDGIKKLAEKGILLDSVEETNENLVKESGEKDKRIAALETENKRLSEDYKNSLDLNDSLKVYSKRMDDKANEKNETIRNKEAEINGMVTPTEYKEISVYCDSLEKEVKELKKENRDMLGKLLVHKRKETTSKSDADKQKDVSNRKATEAKKSIKKEHELNIMNEDAVLEYYYDLLSADTRVEEIKDYILSCKTVMEAQTKYLRLKGTLEGEENIIIDLENNRDVYAGNGFKAKESDSIVVEDLVEEDFKIRKGWK